MFGYSEFWVIWSCFHHSWSKTNGAHERHLVWTPWLMFGDSVLVILWLKKMSDEEGKWKHLSTVFKTHDMWLNGNLINKLSQWAPSPVHCHITNDIFSFFFLSFFFKPTLRLFFYFPHLLLCFSFFFKPTPTFFFFFFLLSFSFFLSSLDPLHHFHTYINLYPETKTHTSFDLNIYGYLWVYVCIHLCLYVYDGLAVGLG